MRSHRFAVLSRRPLFFSPSPCRWYRLLSRGPLFFSPSSCRRSRDNQPPDNRRGDRQGQQALPPDSCRQPHPPSRESHGVALSARRRRAGARAVQLGISGSGGGCGWVGRLGWVWVWAGGWVGGWVCLPCSCFLSVLSLCVACRLDVKKNALVSAVVQSIVRTASPTLKRNPCLPAFSPIVYLL